VVNLPDAGSYDIRIGSALLEGFGAQLRSFNHAPDALVISDSNVARHYLKKMKESLLSGEYRVTEIILPAGEASKSLDCVREIWEAMAAAKLGRDCLVVALGGGVVGDIAGFVASTYMRGVELVQVPTSLLAMVDSSVGGKTGINLAAGKNLVGSFKQPAYVCASVDVLATLPGPEWACGLAEVAKSAVIDSDDFFFWLSEVAPLLANRDIACAAEAITRSVVFKANVVSLDVEERKGIRECLNYGHSLGHAIEACAGFGRFSHGQAVAEGMRFAARLGVALVDTPLDFVAAQDELLDALGLPGLQWSAPPLEILEAMQRDKKKRAGALRFVLPRDVGSWEVLEVDTDTLLEHLGAWHTSKEGGAQ